MAKHVGGRTALQIAELLLSKPWTVASFSREAQCSKSAAHAILQRETSNGYLVLSNAPRQPGTRGTWARLYTPVMKLERCSREADPQ